MQKDTDESQREASNRLQRSALNAPKYARAHTKQQRNLIDGDLTGLLVDATTAFTSKLAHPHKPTYTCRPHPYTPAPGCVC